jgi:hypothetical protein
MMFHTLRKNPELTACRAPTVFLSDEPTAAKAQAAKTMSGL